MSFVCFTKPGSTVELIPASKLNNKKVKDVRLQLGQESNLLGIRYGTFQESLDDELILSSTYPLIIQENTPNRLKIPEYTLLPISLSNKNTKWICAAVASNSNVSIPKFLIQILPEQMTLSINEFLKVASNFLDIENTPIKFTANDMDIENTKNVMDLFQLAKESLIVYHCEIGRQGLHSISKRINVINEILDTEQSYIQILETVTKFWMPELITKKLLVDTDVDDVFAEFIKIYATHDKFMKDFKSNFDGYATEIATIFMQFAEKFEIAILYISHYAQFADQIDEKSKTASIRKALSQLAAKQDSKDLMSFLISPVQRYPRYALFLRDISKCTPTSHPDFLLLKDAVSSIDNFLRKSDNSSKTFTRLYNLEKIAKNLRNEFTIMSPNRELIDEFPITVKGHHSNSGVFYIFNDIILLTKEQQKGVSALFDCPTHRFHYIQPDDSENSIIVSAICKSYNQSIMNPRKDYLVCFNDEQNMKKFFQTVKTAQAKIAKDFEYSLEWSLKPSGKLGPVMANSAVANGSEYFFFGGQKENTRIASNILTAINQFTLEYEEISVQTHGRFGHTMTLIGTRLFIIGGKSKLKFYKKVLCYDLKTNMWLHLIPNTEVSFMPRYGHTSSMVDSRIIIFGGKNDKDEVLNTVTVFDPFSNTFVNVSCKKSPPPRYHHSASVYGTTIIIHGGKSSHRKLLSDTWEFDTIKMQWREIITRGDQVIPRKCHSSFIYGNYFVVVGGVTNSNEIAESLMINVNNAHAKIVRDIGNVPIGLRKFANFCDRQGKFYVYGGCERKSKNPLSSFYTLTPNDKWAAGTVKEMQSETPHMVRTQRSNTVTRRLFSNNEPDFDTLLNAQTDFDNFDLEAPQTQRPNKKKNSIHQETPLALTRVSSSAERFDLSPTSTKGHDFSDVTPTKMSGLDFSPVHETSTTLQDDYPPEVATPEKKEQEDPKNQHFETPKLAPKQNEKVEETPKIVPKQSEKIEESPKVTPVKRKSSLKDSVTGIQKPPSKIEKSPSKFEKSPIERQKSPSKMQKSPNDKPKSPIMKRKSVDDARRLREDAETAVEKKTVAQKAELIQKQLGIVPAVSVKPLSRQEEQILKKANMAFSANRSITEVLFDLNAMNLTSDSSSKSSRQNSRQNSKQSSKNSSPRKSFVPNYRASTPVQFSKIGKPRSNTIIERPKKTLKARLY